MFNNFNLTDQEILTIIDNYKNLINRYATVDGKLDEDLGQEIKLLILSKNRKIEKN